MFTHFVNACHCNSCDMCPLWHNIVIWAKRLHWLPWKLINTASLWYVLKCTFVISIESKHGRGGWWKRKMGLCSKGWSPVSVKTNCMFTNRRAIPNCHWATTEFRDLESKSKSTKVVLETNGWTQTRYFKIQCTMPWRKDKLSKGWEKKSKTKP